MKLYIKISQKEQLVFDEEFSGFFAHSYIAISTGNNIMQKSPYSYTATIGLHGDLLPL